MSETKLIVKHSRNPIAIVRAIPQPSRVESNINERVKQLEKNSKQPKTNDW